MKGHEAFNKDYERWVRGLSIHFWENDTINLAKGRKKELQLPLIKPMEPVLIRELPQQEEGYVYQVKWDGIRLLAYVDHGNTQLYTRNHQLRTSTYPEITYELNLQFPNRELILDGEAIVFHHQQSDFFQLLKRDRLKDPNKIKQISAEIPVIYVVFDLLYLDGQWLINEPFKKRMDALRPLLITTPVVHGCSTIREGKRLWEYVQQKGWEGMVMKKEEAAYYPGEKHPFWKKIKLTQKVEGFVLGVTFRGEKINSLLIGGKEEDAWQYMGKVSSGLTQKEIELLTDWVNSVKMDDPPIVRGAAKKEDVIWVPPYLKVIVEFMEWTRSGTMRSPVIRGYSFEK